jgi:serine/threonine-protein phosphatase PP1 catalytic subunit
MSQVGGLYSECVHKLNETMWVTFCRVFDTMPIAAVVDSKFFCVHGGISPKLERLDQIRAIRRPVDVLENALVMDLLWADPSPDITDFSPSRRGGTFLFGLNATQRFLAKSGLEMIVRAHQVAFPGYDYPFFPLKTVVTVFTASDYLVKSKNKAAFIAIGRAGEWEVQIVPSVIIWKKSARMTSTMRRPHTMSPLGRSPVQQTKIVSPVYRRTPRVRPTLPTI